MANSALLLQDVPCDLCGSDSRELLLQAPDYNHHVAGLFTVVRCRRCALVYQCPRPTAETLGAAYPSVYGPHGKDPHEPHALAARFEGWRGRLKRSLADLYYLPDKHNGRLGERIVALPFYLYARLLRVILLPGRDDAGLRVLDIGCGTGQFLTGMAAKGWDVWGVEPNMAAAGQARHVLGARVQVGALRPGMFPPGSFDLITMWHVLEHLPNPLDSLREVRQLLKPGGWFVATTPNIGSLEFGLFRDKWFPLDLPRHLYFFTPATLGQALEAVGLSRVRIACQIEPGDLDDSLRIVADAGGAAGRIAAVLCGRAPLWPLSACLAWIQQSGILVAYARKDNGPLAANAGI